MNSQLERLENNQVKLTIEVSAEKFEEGMKYAFNKIKNIFLFLDFVKERLQEI